MKALIQGILAGTEAPDHAAASREALERLQTHFYGDLPPELRPDYARPPRAAAVLVPLIEHADGLTLLLTRRTDTLPEHPGQVAFPGGRVEPHDTGILDAALRETEEEIGLPRNLVAPAGYLQPYLTITGYTVVPVVGFIQPDFPPLQADPTEVADIFEVPFDFLLDRRNHHRETHEYRGHEVSYYVIHYDGYRIWGATAAMLVDFVEMIHRERAVGGKPAAC